MIEQVIVALVVLGAAGFMGRRVWRAAAAAKPGCGDGCDGCGH